VFKAPADLPDDPATLQAILRAALAEIERLQFQRAGLKRNRFGRRSETLDDETLQQATEDLEQSVAEKMAGLQAAAKPAEPPPSRAQSPNGAPPKRNRGALPAHLPRVEVIVDIADKACTCCGGLLHQIGEDQAEMLDYVPAQFRVRVIRRPRYGCRACENAVVQAPAPDRPIDGGMATEALLAQVLIGKYCDHLPLYRQSQIFARQAIKLDRSTLCNWVGRACWWLAPLHELMLSTVLSSPKVFADDTTLPVLDPGRGRTKTGRLWCYAVDNRPWQGPRSSCCRLCLQRRPQGGASGDPSEGIPRTPSGRRLFGVWPTGEGRRWAAAGILLGPRAAQVLRHSCRNESAACRGGSAPDRGPV
jgi:transposase